MLHCNNLNKCRSKICDNKRHFLSLGNVTCSAYPIAQLDSIDSKTGELNPVSALNLIVFGVSRNNSTYNHIFIKIFLIEKRYL